MPKLIAQYLNLDVSRFKGELLHIDLAALEGAQASLEASRRADSRSSSRSTRRIPLPAAPGGGLQ